MTMPAHNTRMAGIHTEKEETNMLVISDDNKRFIATAGETGAACFIRGEHIREAKMQGLDLREMENVTFEYWYGDGGRIKKTQSIGKFLNKA